MFCCSRCSRGLKHSWVRFFNSLISSITKRLNGTVPILLHPLTFPVVVSKAKIHTLTVEFIKINFTHYHIYD